MLGPGASVTTESPNKKRIPCKDKREKTLETLIRVKESIQEPDNPIKWAIEDIIPDEKKFKINTYTI